MYFISLLYKFIQIHFMDHRFYENHFIMQHVVAVRVKEFGNTVVITRRGAEGARHFCECSYVYMLAKISSVRLIIIALLMKT